MMWELIKDLLLVSLGMGIGVVLITYGLRPKTTYAGKAVKLDKQALQETITAVRSVSYVPD